MLASTKGKVAAILMAALFTLSIPSILHADYWLINYCGDIDSYEAMYIESDIDGMFFTYDC